MDRFKDTMALYRASSIVAVANALLVLALEGSHVQNEGGVAALGWTIFFSALGGFIGPVILIQLTVVPLETLHGILSKMGLLLYSRLDKPPLKTLIKDAPGTWSHSLIMSQLSEAAALAIGADALFCRVACYYHDIGKSKFPQYFVENLKPGEPNPHDSMKPSMSVVVISGHVKNGI